MIAQKYFKIIFSIILIVYSFVAFAQTDSIQVKRMSERKLTKNIISQYCEYDNITLKINAKIISPKKTYNLNISYRNIKDSIIWINVNHNSGIPVARFLITPDSTKMINRIDKHFLSMSNQQIVQKLGYDLSFDMIQAIFTAQLINLNSKKNLMQVYKHYKVYQDSNRYVLQNIKRNKLHRLQKKDKMDEHLIHKVQVDNYFKIISTSIQDYINHQEIEIKYPQYQKDKKCMKEIYLSLKREDKTILMELKIKKIKRDKAKISFPFKVPEKYKKS